MNKYIIFERIKIDDIKNDDLYSSKIYGSYKGGVLISYRPDFRVELKDLENTEFYKKYEDRSDSEKMEGKVLSIDEIIGEFKKCYGGLINE